MIAAMLMSLGTGMSAYPGPAPLVSVDFSRPIVAVRVYPEAGEVVELSALPMIPDTERAYLEDFIPGTTYFGAFAIGKDGSYGYATGVNTIEAARDIAFEECEKHSPGCLIYAEILPLGYAPVGRGEVTLSSTAAEYYANPGDRPAHRAMAVSEDGAYSLVWGYGSAAAAQEAAVADCEEYRVLDLPGLRDMPCILLPLK